MSINEDTANNEAATAVPSRLAPGHRHRKPRAFAVRMAVMPFRAVIAGLRRRAGWRHNAAMLGALDDRALADLGIVRGDLARSETGFAWASSER
jgi:uncharacterized protein YjiS (DUF1127 family)